MKLKCALWMMFAILGMSSVFASTHSPVGYWTTIDDKTGQKRSEVYLSMHQDALSGKIVKIYPQPGDTGICQKCPGALKNKPIKNLVFLWGLTANLDGSWSGGEILDPKSGKVYHARMIQKGDKLYVRGYVGMPFLGRTQIWTRSQ